VTGVAGGTASEPLALRFVGPQLEAEVIPKQFFEQSI
jgi:hypothetical protein